MKSYEATMTPSGRAERPDDRLERPADRMDRRAGGIERRNNGAKRRAGGVEHPPGRVERLAGKWVFKALTGLSMGLMVLLLLLGLAVAALMLLFLRLDESWIPAALVLCGSLGLAGLLRSSGSADSSSSPQRRRRRSTSSTSSTSDIELTIVFLAAGMAAALVPVGLIVVSLASPTSTMSAGPAATLAAPFVILILAAIGKIEKIKRSYARHVGARFDTLPVIFLLVSLAMALGASVVISAL